MSALSTEAASSDWSPTNRSSHQNNPSNKRYRRIVASSGVGVIQRLIQVASTLVVLPVMFRVLGPARFGPFRIAPMRSGTSRISQSDCIAADLAG